MMRTALTRMLVAAFWMTTALYALLSASPFASQQFLQPRLVPAIAAFAVWHAPLSLGVLVIVMVGLLPYLRSGDRVVWAFSGMWLGTALLEVMSGGLASLRPSSIAVAVAVGALIPPVWLALLDLGGLEHGRRDPARGWSKRAQRFRRLRRRGDRGDPDTGGAHAERQSIVAQWSAGVREALILHLAIFSAMFAVISIVRGLARPTPHPGRGRDVAGPDRRDRRRGTLRPPHHPGGAAP